MLRIFWAERRNELRSCAEGRWMRKLGQKESKGQKAFVGFNKYICEVRTNACTDWPEQLYRLWHDGGGRTSKVWW